MELIQKTIGEYLRENAEKYQDRPAMETRDYSCTFREVDEITDFLAVKLYREWKVRKGTHVGIWSVNTPDYVFLFLAMVKIGAVPVPLNTCFREEELSEILNSMDIEVLFYGDGWKDLVYEEMIPGIRTLSPKVRAFITIRSLGGDPYLRPESFSEEERLPEVRDKAARLGRQVCAEDTACIIMTSGTTLAPKGVLLSHFNIVNDGRFAAREMRWSDRDKMLIVLPMFHCFGMITGVVGCVLNGMEMYIVPHFGTHAVWYAINERNCTVMNGVPSIFLALVRKADYRDVVSHSLKSGIIGGSVMREEDYLEICSRFPSMHLQSSYGMTEGAPSISFVDWDAPLTFKAKSCGKLMEKIEGRIVDPKTGAVMDPGKNGELQLRGFNITSGYYNMPEETKKAFTEDGFFRTGDLGYFDEAGNLFITGRLKELIIRAGENISVAEIEHAIYQSDMAESVKVTSVASDFRQEEIVALVVPEDPDSFSAEKLKDFLKPRLAVYKIPDYIFKVSELPMTGSGKIDLKETRKLAEELVKKTGNNAG